MPETFQFLRFLAGLRGPRTSLTSAEQALLEALARDRRRIVEVGVYEGATSAVLAAAMAPEGRLALVDPYEPALKVERLFGFSCPYTVARRALRPWRARIRFVRRRSLAAVQELAGEESWELVFIDADHSYEAVREDFFAWRALIAADGLIAFHDSRICSARPDLTPSTGPVRLVSEIERGDLGPWQVVNAADSVTVVGRAGPDSRPPKERPR